MPGRLNGQPALHPRHTTLLSFRQSRAAGRCGIESTRKTRTAATSEREHVMDAVTMPLIEPPSTWSRPYKGTVAMACLIVAESAIFTIFVVAYLYYLGKSLTGPTPRDVLETPIFFTVCLLSSSLTIHLAGKGLEGGSQRAFLGWWLLTIVLGGLFMYGTGQEWHRLIYEHGLTIATNLFGTTYYSLVGLHAFHVTVGLAML